jgi:hypothetical protein
MESITAAIFAVFILVPSLIFTYKFFKKIAAEQRRHDQSLHQKHRRAHWQQKWRRDK